MKRYIEAFDYAGDIAKALPKGGILLTTKRSDTVNVMTIGWGTIGIEWGLPIFTVFVRKGRFTRELLDESGEFTVNAPYNTTDKRASATIAAYCGSHTGRSVNKADALRLTLVPSDLVSPPGIKEFPLTLECKVIYKQLQDKSAILPELCDKFYPDHIDDPTCKANKESHIAYYGQILRAYIIE